MLLDGPEEPPIGQVWQILPNSQEADDQTIRDPMIATNETSPDGIQQIIYVSYQDPNDPNQSRTLHFGIWSMIVSAHSVCLCLCLII